MWSECSSHEGHTVITVSSFGVVQTEYQAVCENF